MRITNHNGRTGKDGAYSARHNDREFSKEAEHIDRELTQNNREWRFNFHDGVARSFDETEKHFYERYLSDSLNAKNERYLAQRHPERTKTMEEYRKSPQSCPEETIRQVGRIDDHTDAATLWGIQQDFAIWHAQTYPQCQILDFALHVDEPGAAPHIHERKVWLYRDEEGHYCVGQAKALDQMGVKPPREYTREEAAEKVEESHRDDETPPDPEKLEREIDKKLHELNHSRHNNPKMTYTEACREKLIELTRSRGIEVEVEPRDASKSGLSLLEYKCAREKEKASQAILEASKANAEKEAALREKEFNQAMTSRILNGWTDQNGFYYQGLESMRAEYGAFMNGWKDQSGAYMPGLPQMRAEYSRLQSSITQAAQEEQARRSNVAELTAKETELTGNVSELLEREKKHADNLEALDGIRDRIRSDKPRVYSYDMPDGILKGTHQVAVVEGYTARDVREVFKRAGVKDAAADIIKQAEEKADAALKEASQAIEEAQRIRENETQIRDEADLSARRKREEATKEYQAILRKSEELKEEADRIRMGYTDPEGNEVPGLSDLHRIQEESLDILEGQQQAIAENEEKLLGLQAEADKNLSMISWKPSEDELKEIASSTITHNLVKRSIEEALKAAGEKGLLKDEPRNVQKALDVKEIVQKVMRAPAALLDQIRNHAREYFHGRDGR